MIFSFLGSGTSHGVPMIGCGCEVCRSDDPRDKRLRASAWLHDDTRSIIIDVGPDFRTQVLRAGIQHLDGVLLTHTHADHLNGIDDLRAFCQKAKAYLPFYAAQQDIDFVRNHFDYIFQDDDFRLMWGIPRLDMRPAEQPFSFMGLDFIPIPMFHGRGHATGYRLGTFAYLSDCSAIPDTSIELLRGVKTVVIDGLRWTPHPTHFSITEALDAIAPLNAERIYITHICHNVSHERDSKLLPPNVQFAYDGLELSINN